MSRRRRVPGYLACVHPGASVTSLPVLASSTHLPAPHLAAYVLALFWAGGKLYEMWALLWEAHSSGHLSSLPKGMISCASFLLLVIFFFFTFKIMYLFTYYWSVIDLQHCVSFRCTAKWFSYIYVYIKYIFQSLFPYRLLQIVECSFLCSIVCSCVLVLFTGGIWSVQPAGSW